MNLMSIDNGSDKIWRGVRGKKIENVILNYMSVCLARDSFNFFLKLIIYIYHNSLHSLIIKIPTVKYIKKKFGI